MGLICHTFILGLTRDLTAPEIPSGMVPIKVSKKTDIDKITRYIPAEHMGFYEDVLKWPIDTETVVDDE